MILSSEAVLVGTVGVIGATVGLKAMGESVNAEMTDIARALRSLDQSYEIRGVKGCGACTAGSSFKQQDVKKSLAELDVVIDKEKAAAAKREAELKERLMRDGHHEHGHDDDHKHHADKDGDHHHQGDQKHDADKKHADHDDHKEGKKRDDDKHEKKPKDKKPEVKKPEKKSDNKKPEKKKRPRQNSAIEEGTSPQNEIIL